MEWPDLQGQELSKLRESFATPLQLLAAFDDISGASMLIETCFPGMDKKGVQIRSTELVNWAKANHSCGKRQRREILAGMWETLPTQPSSKGLVESYDEVVRQNPLALLDGLARRKKALQNDTDQSKRAADERSARDKYTAVLASFIREAKLPVVEYVAGVSQPDAVWLRLFGTRRGRTLRNRAKAWLPFRRWLESVHGRVWPNRISQIIDYCQERFNDSCGKTVLDSFQASLSVLEHAGRVPESEMFCKDATWLSHRASLNADLRTAAPPVQQAPMLTVAMVVSLELHVMKEDEPPFARGIAWIALLMVYCSLRTDDAQAIVPGSLCLTRVGLRGVLGRTKTTGTDRRNREVPIFVERSVSLAGVPWLETGYKLWKGWESKRDFMVPKPVPDWSGPSTHYIKSAVLSGYVREVYRGLHTPKLESGKYRLNPQRPLVVEGAAAHFTGHSPRNWLPSVAAALGHSADDRDFLGRWLIGGKGSAEYTRTARQVVHRIQVSACRAIACGEGGEYLEEEALQAMKDFVDHRGGSGALARRRQDILKAHGQGSTKHLGLSWPTFRVPESLVDPPEDDDYNDVVPDAPTKYFISYSRKTGHRRLHLNGPCHVKPYSCLTVKFVDTVDAADIDSICRDCKHRMKAEQGQAEGAASSSESASSSDSGTS